MRDEGSDHEVSALWHQGRFFGALAAATRQQARDGENYASHAMIAKIESALGLRVRAAVSWASAMRFAEDQPEAHVALGSLAFEEGNVARAKELYGNALSLSPEFVPALVSLSVACLHTNDFDAARRYASSALRVQPGLPEALLCRARAEVACGNLNLAEMDITRLQQDNYRPDEVRLLECDLSRQRGDYEVALCVAAELCDSYPAAQDPLTAFRRGFLEFRKAAPDRFRDFAEALELVPAPMSNDRLELNISPSGINRRAGRVGQVDVIVPVHNAPEAVDDCLSAVLRHATDTIAKIILVDDASDPETVGRMRRLAARDKRIETIRLETRVGFTRALGAGLVQSKAPYFVALNSDTIVPTGWLDRLRDGFETRPDVAMVGPMSNNAAWQNVFPVFDNLGTFAVRDIDPTDLSTAFAQAEVTTPGFVPTPLVHGFCAMVDRQVFDLVGGLDAEAFPEGYGEFQDLSIRLRQQGKICLVASDCLVWHARGASISARRRGALSERARGVLYRKYSALNYLFIEMEACANEALDTLRDRLEPCLRGIGKQP